MLLAGRYGARLGLLRRCVGGARLAQLERAFARHGVWLLLGGRFVPGLRATLLVAAGVARLPLRLVFVADGAAALVGTTVWIAVGWRLSGQLDRARAIVGGARGAVLAAATTAIVVALVVDWQRRRALLTSGARSAPDLSPGASDRSSRSRHRATDT